MYLYVTNDPPKIPKTRIVDKIVKASRIFLYMIKFAIIKALSVTSVLVLILILTLSPLYVTMGLMTRQITTETK